MSTADTEHALEELAREVAGMRIPLLLIGSSVFLLVLAVMSLFALVGGGVASLALMVPLFFTSLPILLFTASGAAAMGGRIDPSKLVLSLNLQLGAWILLLLQGLAMLALVFVALIAALFAFL